MKCAIIIAALVWLFPVILSGQINWTEIPVADDIDSPFSVYAADIDNDGDLDLLGGGDGTFIYWWENLDGIGTNWSEHVVTASFSGVKRVLAIDLNGDSALDVLGAAALADDITWWENADDTGGTWIEHPIADSSVDWAWTVGAADLDGDNDPDVVAGAQSYSSAGLAWWENDGTGNFPNKHIIDDAYSPAEIYLCDLDGDSIIDILTKEIAWWKNDGNGEFTKHLISDSTSLWSVYAADLNGDSAIDLLSMGGNTDSILWWENDGSEDFTMHLIDTLANPKFGFAIDLDNDNDVDVLATGFATHLRWYENDGSANFTEHIITTGLDYMPPIYACDFDDDGDVDVFGVKDGIRWWRSDLADIIDVCPVSIDIPATLPEDTTFMPRATIKNCSGVTAGLATFPITCKINPGAYTSTRSVQNLAPGDSIQISFFTPFTFEYGVYTVRVYTRWDMDRNPTNDTIMKIIMATGLAEDNTSIPTALTFNAPTVSRNMTNIEFTLPTPSKVDLVVYDALGRLAKTIISDYRTPGVYKFTTTLDLATGIYFYTLKTDSGKRIVKKFLIIE